MLVAYEHERHRKMFESDLGRPSPRELRITISDGGAIIVVDVSVIVEVQISGITWQLTITPGLFLLIRPPDAEKFPSIHQAKRLADLEEHEVTAETISTC